MAGSGPHRYRICLNAGPSGEPNRRCIVPLLPVTQTLAESLSDMARSR